MVTPDPGYCLRTMGQRVRDVDLPVAVALGIDLIDNDARAVLGVDYHPADQFFNGPRRLTNGRLVAGGSHSACQALQLLT
jgi:hypothetical protein